VSVHEKVFEAPAKLSKAVACVSSATPDENSMIFRNMMLAVVALMLCNACNALDGKNPPREMGLPHQEGGDLRSLVFLSGRPSGGEGLFSALAEPEEAEKALHENLDMISRSNSLRFRAVGWTDDLECSAHDCTELSLRRARLVTDWLREHGVPGERISSPLAGGKYFGEAYRPSEAERTVARRVDIESVM
jgi:hypothetical protein